MLVTPNLRPPPENARVVGRLAIRRRNCEPFWTLRAPTRTKEFALLNLLLFRNEHTIDRVVRIVVGLVLLALVFVGTRTAWGYLGIVPLLTGVLGSCPVYTLLGIGTCPINRKPAV